MNRLIEKKYAVNPVEKEAALRDIAQLNALDDAEKKLAEIYRRTMIFSAPANFKPEAFARKIRLKLILEKSTIRKGGHPRYRLEMTNVGREAIDYQEYDSSLFVKNAGMGDSRVMHLYFTDPRGHRARSVDPHWPSGKSDDMKYLPNDLPEADKKKWLAETAAMSEASNHFQVKLMPGETLHSIGDDDSPVENFRTFLPQSDYHEPGTYRLQVELDDRPRPMSKNFIEVNLRTGSSLKELERDHNRQMRDAFGPVSSNVATFEVAP